MQCFHPLTAYKLSYGGVAFDSNADNVVGPVQLRCGQCIGCMLTRSVHWAVRCVHESRMHALNSFVTLTYDPKKSQTYRDSLVHRDFQLFAKRLRIAVGPFRYFMCGEYQKNGSPHFHALLFGVFFSDRKFFKTTDAGCRIYTSELLQRVWQDRGHSSTADVSFDSAAYVARYTCKKFGDEVSRLGIVDMSTGEFLAKAREYCRMSLKPGIGYPWWEKYRDEYLVRDKCVVGGVEYSVPRAYDRWLEEIDDCRLQEIKKDRVLAAREFSSDATEERLVVKEVVAKAALGFKRSTL